MILLAHSFYLRRDRKQLKRAKPYPPLTTLIAAAMLREAGHEVALFDATFAASAEAFGDAVQRLSPDIVLLIEDNFNFLTKMCTEERRRDALAMVAVAAQHGCRVAVNGPDASDHPELYLDAGAAAVAVGEGEFAVSDLALALERHDALAGTPGLIVRNKAGGMIHTIPRQRPRDPDEVPFPAWDLLDADSYRSTWSRAHGYLSWNVAASRGCPYRCNWCAKPTFGRRYAQRSPASVAEEIARLKAAVAPDHIWFADDIFGMTEQWILDFSYEVIRRGAVTPFMMQTRANLIDRDVAEALRAGGAEEVWLGIESGSQKILDAMDKGTRVESARLATRTLQRVGIRVGWFLQLGYPTEDWEDILMTRDLVREERPEDVGVSVSYPLPGTEFYERVVGDLGARRNWRDTDDLAMLFRGTFDTLFYRKVRDALHAEVSPGGPSDQLWRELADEAPLHRIACPSTMRPPALHPTPVHDGV